MGLPQHLRPRPGDDVETFWRRLEDWYESTDVVVGAPGLTYQVTSLGTAVEYRPRNAWAAPFRVSASASVVQVDPGFVNDHMPRIEGVTLDGVDAAGKLVDVPRLAIEPVEDGVSWVVVAVQVDAGGVVINPEDNEEAVTIQHVTDELDAAFIQGGYPDDEGTGIQPLARISWREGRVSRVFQIVYHNLGHRFKQGGGESANARGRHFFFAQG